MSFRGYKRSIKLEFDYNEIKDGVPNVKQQMAVLNAEFRKSSAEATASGKTLDQLGVKYDFLSNKIKLQEQEVEKYRKQLEKAESAQGANSKAVQNATASLQIAEAKLNQTKAELSAVSKELDKQKGILGKTSEEWEKLGDKTTKIGKDLTMKLTVPILAAGAGAFKMAAELEQNLNKVGEIFEENAVLVEKWAKDSIKNMGMAQSTALDMAALFGDMGEGMGLNSRYVLEYSTSLTQLAADLASFKDVSLEVAKTALTSVYTGETESLKKLGVVMTEVNLQEFAYSQGISKRVRDMTQAEKVQLRYNYVMDVTSKAHGDFQRTSEDASNQVRIFQESIKELGESFGEEVIPMVTPVISFLTDMVQGFAELDAGTKKFIVTAAGILAIIGPVTIMFGSMFKAISNISGGMKAAKDGIELVSKVGKSLKGALDTTAFFGIAKWVVLIGAAVMALALLIEQINILMNKRSMVPSISEDLRGLIDTAQTTVNGGGVRAFAVGTNYVERDQLALIHKGEAIIPANMNPYNPNSNNTVGGGDTFILQVKMDEVDEVQKLVRVFDNFKQAKRAGVVSG